MNILNDCRVVFMVQKQTVSQFELASKQRDSTPGFSYSSRNRLMSGIILVVDNNFIYSPPSDGKPFRLSLGLRELQVENWIEGGSDLLDQLRQRNELLDTKREVVFQSVSGYELPTEYFASLLKENLAMFHSDYHVDRNHIVHIPSGYEVDIGSDHPFVQIARVICEDLALLVKDGNTWKLIAGVIIFPSRWNLLEKVGKDIDAIHSPLPGYAASLAPYMVETFNKISPDRPVWRRNWSLHCSDVLHEPTYTPLESAVEDYWWRTERQTLTKSLDGEFLLFTIRNRTEPLKWIKGDPEASLQFARTLESLTPEMLEYKRITAQRELLLSFLRS